MNKMITMENKQRRLPGPAYPREASPCAAAARRGVAGRGRAAGAGTVSALEPPGRRGEISCGLNPPSERRATRAARNEAPCDFYF